MSTITWREPNDRGQGRRLCSMLNNLGVHLHREGRLTEARQRFEEAVEARLEAMQMTPAAASHEGQYGSNSRREEKARRHLNVLEKNCESHIDATSTSSMISMFDRDCNNSGCPLGTILIGKEAETETAEDGDTYSAIIVYNMAVLHHQLQDLSQAFNFYEKATYLLGKTRSFRGSPRIIFARALHGMGCILYQDGRLEVARTTLNEALEVAENVVSREQLGCRELAAMIINVGRIQYELGELEEAMASCQRALACLLGASSSTHHDHISIKYNIALIYLQKDDVTNAIRLFTQVREEFERYLGPTHASIVSCAYNTGVARFNKGELAAAKASFIESLRISQAIHGCNAVHDDIAEAIYYIGRIMHDQDNYRDALDMYKRALTMQRYLYGNTDLRVARTCCNIGRIHVLLGEVADALEANYEVLRVVTDSPGNETFAAEIFRTIGDIHLENGEADDAAAAFSESMRIEAMMQNGSEAEHSNPNYETAVDLICHTLRQSSSPAAAA